MKVAVIGSGNVGNVLGSRWAASGHQVIFGARNPDSEKVQAVLASAGENAQAVSVQEAAAGADVVVLAVPWQAAENAVRAAGNLEGKVVIDCINPVVMEGNTMGLGLGHTTSAAEQIAGWAAGARVVKAFNATGVSNMADPMYGGEAATMFICGDDEEAKTVAAGLAEDLGFEVCDSGPLLNARYLEPMAMLWIYLAFPGGLGPEIAFKLVKR